MSDFPPPSNASDFPPKGAEYPPAGNQPQSQPQPGGYQTPPPQQPAYPPPSDQPGNYQAPSAQPRQGGYQPSGNSPGDDLLLDDLGTDRRRSGRDDSYRERTQEPSRIELDDFESRDLRRERNPREEDDYSAPRLDERRSNSPRGALLTERQVEAVGWGLTVILFGFAILFSFTSSNTNFLTVGFPIIGGILLMASSVYQRIQGWRVSVVTWATAIGLSSFSITRLIALTDGKDTGVGTSIAYFFGIFMIITGTAVLVRFFQAR